MSDVKPETIKMRGPACNKKLGFPPQAVGRNAKCPACAHVFKVGAAPGADPALAGMASAAQAPRVIPPAPRPREDDDSSLLALAAGEESAAAVEMSAEEAARAQALASASAHRQAMAGTVEPPPIPSRAQAAAAKAEARAGSGAVGALGSLAKGCLFSVGAALLGAFIWYGIAKATGYQIGYVAWGVGLLAGFGMHLGIRAESVIAGLIAAAIALAGIILGEFMVVEWVAIPQVEKEIKAEAEEQAKVEATVQYQRNALIEMQAEKLLKSQGIDPEEAEEAQELKANAEARKLVASWNDAKVRSEYKQYKAGQPDESSDSGSLKDMPTGFFVLFFLLFFGLKGIIFSILAMASAFKIGASGLSFGSS